METAGQANRTRAILAGYGTFGLAVVEGAFLLAVAVIVGLFVHPAVGSLAWRYGIPIGSHLLVGVALLVAGYAAASRVERGKTLVGLLLSISVALLSIGMAAPFALLLEGRTAADTAATGWEWSGWATTLVLPILGSLLQGRRKDGQPVLPSRSIGVAVAYALLLLGGLVASCTFLIAGLYDGSFKPFARWQVWLVGAALLLLPAWALLLLHNRGGLKKCLLRSPAGWTCLALIGCFVGGFIESDLDNRPDPSVMQGLVAQMRQRDGIPDEDNGAEQVSLAVHNMRDVQTPDTDLPSGVWEPEAYPDWRDYADAVAEALSMLRQASAKPIDYPLAYVDDGNGAGIADDSATDEARTAARALRLEACRADVEMGDSLACLDAAVRIAAPLRKRTHWDALSSAAQESAALEALRDILLAQRPRRGDLEQAAELLGRWEDVCRVDPETRCLLARIEAAHALHDMYAMDLNGRIGGFLVLRIFDMEHMSSVVGERLDAFCRDFRSLPPAHVFRKHRHRFTLLLPGPAGRKGNPLGTLEDILVDLAIGYRAYPLECSLGSAAKRELLRGWVAAARMWDAERRLPRTWQDLVPKYLQAAPEDPFTGRPLGLLHAENALVMYSVGVDGEDAGGDGFFSNSERNAENRRLDDEGLPDSVPDDIVLKFEVPDA